MGLRNIFNYIVIFNILNSGMREENKKINWLNILCVGQVQAGKTYFLKQYSNDETKQTLCGPYDIYAKKLNDFIIFFHELSEQEDLYLSKYYDGIIFFVDIINHWNVADKILKWIELQSKYSGENIFKIPLRIIITKSKGYKREEKWRKSLERELKSVVNLNQVIYFDSLISVQGHLQQYFQQIIEGTAMGIKSSNENHLKLYGFNQLFKLFVINVKLTFLRCFQLYDKRIRSKLWSDTKVKNNKIK